MKKPVRVLKAVRNLKAKRVLKAREPQTEEEIKEEQELADIGLEDTLKIIESIEKGSSERISISTFESGTKHTLTLPVSLSPEVPHDSLPVRIDIIFQRNGKRRVAGSKLTTLTHQSADEQVECQMPRVYKKGGREFQVFVEFWSEGKRLTSTFDGYCHLIQVQVMGITTTRLK